MLVFGTMTQHTDFGHAKDALGIGRWVITKLQGEHGFVTRIFCGYNPCDNAKKHSGTVYQQHRRYFLTQQWLLTCPRVKFREDLLAQLLEWRDQGDRLIVCLYKKSLRKELSKMDGLAIKEVVGEFTGK